MSNKIYLMNAEDQETAQWAERLSVNPIYDRNPALGGQKCLEQVRAATPLSIMAHGTAELAVVVKQGQRRRWSPAEMAQQLENDGLQHDHRSIELLVCEAAAAVNTVKGAEELEALRQKYIAETNPAKKALIKQQFEKLEKEAPSLVNYNEWTKGWLLPLGAAFMQEMKKLNYQNLRVFCYRYSVSAHFTQGLVWLLDPEKGDRKATEEDRVQWL